MPVRWLLIPLAALAYCFAQQPEKPPCNAQNRGKLWPEGNARTACTGIEMCTMNVWKYRWEPVTLSVSRLAKDPKLRTSCESAGTGSTRAAHAALAGRQAERLTAHQ